MKYMINLQRTVIFAVACALLCSANVVTAKDGSVCNAKLKIERVALFKNGMGFLSSNTTIPDNAKTLNLGQLPVPSFGTFLVEYEKDVNVRGLFTSIEELEENVPIKNLMQLLQLNPGCKVTFHTGTADKESVIEGIVMETTKTTKFPEPPNPYFMDIRQPRNAHGQYSYNTQKADIVLVKTSNGITAMNANAVTRADFEKGDIVSSVPIIKKYPSIRLELDRPAGGKKISLSYLAKGVTWVPGYFIDLSDSKTAKFSAHAVVINELTDFKNVELELVTGFPNIKFGEVHSPVSMSQKLADFLNSLESGRTKDRRRGGSHMMTQQRILTNVAVSDGFESPPVPGYSTAVEGLISEDLFLYPVKDFTLKKGETAWIPLFTAEMPFKHIYTWKIGDFVDKKSDRYVPEPERADGKSTEEVWHSCRLLNNLKMPLTTAAAEFVKDGKFTGQDVCYYTAPGTKTTIRINRAMNVLAEQAEVEVERKRNDARFYGYQYDLVKVEGKMKLKSRLDKKVDVEILKELSGDVLSTTPKSKDVKTAKGLKRVNSKHELTWEIELRSGEEMELSYQYQVYIRS